MDTLGEANVLPQDTFSSVDISFLIKLYMCVCARTHTDISLYSMHALYMHTFILIVPGTMYVYYIHVHTHIVVPGT